MQIADAFVMNPQKLQHGSSAMMGDCFHQIREGNQMS
jgi:hypothetical protein